MGEEFIFFVLLRFGVEWRGTDDPQINMDLSFVSVTMWQTISPNDSTKQIPE